MSRRSTLRALLSQEAAGTGVTGGAGAVDAAAEPAGSLGLAHAPGSGGLARLVPNPAPAPARGSGAVRALGLELSRLVDDAAAGERIVEIDPALIAPSPVRDRLDEGDPRALEGLIASIRAHGQHVPILVREEADDGLTAANGPVANGAVANSPAADGPVADGRDGAPCGAARYRIAFGHRRWGACRALGIPVRAVVADLSDEAMIVAQGQENAERRDLSFIERAGFAAELEGRGCSRRLIGEALACDKSEVSRLLAVCRTVPFELVRAIGRAPGVGRPRWLALGEALRGEGAAERAHGAASADDFAALDTDARFAAILKAAHAAAPSPRAGSRVVSAPGPDGEMRLATLRGGRTLTLEAELQGDFADWLADRLPHLVNQWRAR